MAWQTKFAKLVKDDFEARKAKNSRLSLRQFARRLGLSVGHLSKLLRGTGTLTESRAAEILERLEISRAERQSLLAAMGWPVKAEWQDVESANWDILVDWRVQGIVGLIEVDRPRLSLTEIAKRLNLSLDFVQAKAQELEQRGLLKRNDEGELARPPESWFANDTKMPPNVIDKIHEDQLELVRLAKQQIGRDHRFFISTSFTASVAQQRVLREEILKMIDRITALNHDTPKEELFRLSIQLFPFNFAAQITKLESPNDSR